MASGMGRTMSSDDRPRTVVCVSDVSGDGTGDRAGDLDVMARIGHATKAPEEIRHSRSSCALTENLLLPNAGVGPVRVGKSCENLSVNSDHHSSNTSLQSNTSNVRHSAVESLRSGHGGGSPYGSPNSSPKMTPRVIPGTPFVRSDSNGSTSREASMEKTSLTAPGSSPAQQDLSADSGLAAEIRSVDSTRSSDFTRSDTSRLSDISRDRKESRDSRDSRDSRGSDKSKRRPAWYSMLNPTYKSRSEEFRRLFKEVPSEERLIVDYSCAMQRDILVHGRLYVSQNFICFHANIFRWETCVIVKCRDVTALTKEKTALVIPNAIQISTDTEKYFFTSFGARDKAYLMVFRIWQNALLDQQMEPTELWQWVHQCYGDELGLTSDDDDYVAPSTEDDSRDLMTKPTSFDTTIEDVHEGVNEDDRLQKLGCSVSASPAPTNISLPTCQDIPTDLSDTSEIEPEVKDHPTCPLSGSHLGKEAMNMSINLPVDQLFTQLFTPSKFFLDFLTATKCTDVVQSPWQSSPDTGQRVRTVTYTRALEYSVGPRSCSVTETQYMSPQSRHGQLYVVDVEVSNAGIPYADCFVVTKHFCLTKVTNNQSRITVWCDIRYRKSIWGFMKSLIEKNTWQTLEEHHTQLEAALLADTEESSGKVRRTRRRRTASKSAGGESGLGESREPTPLHHRTRAPSLANSETASPTTARLIWFIFVALVVMVVFDVLLYYRLWSLDERTRPPRDPLLDLTPLDLTVLRSAVRRPEDWLRLLRRQEELHRAELARLHQVVAVATRLLRQTEAALHNLSNTFEPPRAQWLIRLIQEAAAEAAGDMGRQEL